MDFLNDIYTCNYNEVQQPPQPAESEPSTEIAKEANDGEIPTESMKILQTDRSVSS